MKFMNTGEAETYVDQFAESILEDLATDHEGDEPAMLAAWMLILKKVGSSFSHNAWFRLGQAAEEYFVNNPNTTNQPREDK